VFQQELLLLELVQRIPLGVPLALLSCKQQQPFPRAPPSPECLDHETSFELTFAFPLPLSPRKIEAVCFHICFSELSKALNAFDSQEDSLIRKNVT
jgi:hypothetical protein